MLLNTCTSDLPVVLAHEDVAEDPHGARGYVEADQGQQAHAVACANDSKRSATREGAVRWILQ
jgi:hypothetical protein